MCMVSNIGDNWGQTFPQKWPNFWPVTKPPSFWPASPVDVSREEVEALRREIEELKKLLTAAKEFDKATGQPDCEMDEKVKMIKAIAKMVGVDLGNVFGKEPTA